MSEANRLSGETAKPSSRRLSGQIPLLLFSPLVFAVVAACSGSSSSPIPSSQQTDPSGTDPEKPSTSSSSSSSSSSSGSTPHTGNDASDASDASTTTDAGKKDAAVVVVDASADASTVDATADAAADAGSTCDGCITTSCASQQAACSSDPLCVSLKQCLDACEDADCRSDCFVTFPNAAAKAKNGALYKCQCVTSCSSQCTAECN
jgi:cytoskeletal protein RodZ